MRERFYRFMQGRNGPDALSKFTMGVSVALVILAFLAGRTRFGSLLDTLGVAGLIYTYFRIFSRNLPKRYQENVKFLQKTEKLRFRWNKEKYLMNERKTNHIYTCPECHQKVRVPKGKGRIEISCPKCQHKFVKRS